MNGAYCGTSISDGRLSSGFSLPETAITDKWHPRSDAGSQSQESLEERDRPITEVRIAMKLIRRVSEMARANAEKAATSLTFTFQKIDTFLRSEDGNMTAEAALFATSFAISTLWPNPVIALVLEIALLSLSRLKGK